MPCPPSSSRTVGGVNARPSCTATGYDHRRCRQALSKRHIKVRIARRLVDSSQRLGRHRWVVERTFAWLNRFRRLAIRYERRADIHQAFLTLGCALNCFRSLP
jgi:transposase